MANAVYPLARQRLLEWAFGGSTPAGFEGIFICGVNEDYTYSAAHENVSDLTGVVGPETELLNVTFTNGVVDADDAQIDGMTTSETLNALVIYAKFAADDLLLV
jgi:hypothetical protein